MYIVHLKNEADVGNQILRTPTAISSADQEWWGVGREPGLPAQCFDTDPCSTKNQAVPVS